MDPRTAHSRSCLNGVVLAAAWIQALGTLAALYFLIRQIDGLRQSNDLIRQQLSAQEGELRDQREHDRRAQADGVWASIQRQRREYPRWEGPVFEMAVRTQSNLPIYFVMVALADIRVIPAEDGNKAFTSNGAISMIAPHEGWVLRVEDPGGAAGFRPGAEVGFTDASGTHWVQTTPMADSSN